MALLLWHVTKCNKNTTAAAAAAGFIRWSTSLFFTGVRSLARALAYLGSLAGVVGTALTFTVVAAIVLSIVSTVLGVMQVSLLAFADGVEPLVMKVLSWFESGTGKVSECHRVTSE
jgi:hypothetical protein